MRDTTVVEPEVVEGEAGVAAPVPATAETACSTGPRARRLIMATAISVAAATLATALAIVLSRRRAALGAEPGAAAPRPAPTSTINVNWGFALLGSNVLAERRRSAGALRARLLRRR